MLPPFVLMSDNMCVTRMSIVEEPSSKKIILLEGWVGKRACCSQVDFRRWHSNCVEHELSRIRG